MTGAGLFTQLLEAAYFSQNYLTKTMNISLMSRWRLPWQKKEAHPAPVPVDITTTVEGVSMMNWLAQRGRVGSATSIRGIFKDMGRLTPQVRMWHLRQLFNENNYMHTGVMILKNLLIGGEITVDTKDKHVKTWLEEEYFPYTDFTGVVREGTEHALWSGNAYHELRRTKRDEPGDIVNISRPDQMFIDVDPKTGEIVRFVQRLPQHLTQFLKMSTVTIHDSTGRPFTIYGKVLDAKNIYHLKVGQDDYSEYGQSPAIATVNDGAVMMEMERGAAIYARWRMSGKKYFMLKNAGNPAVLDQFQERLKLVDDYEDVALSVPPEGIDVITPTAAGSIAYVTPLLEHFKRKMTINYVPEYAIHGQNVNRATSKTQKKSFDLAVMAWRDTLNKCYVPFLKRIVKFYNISADPVFTLQYGNLDTPTPEEYKKEMKDLWTLGVITHDEMREGFARKIDSGLKGVYKWEIDAASQPVEDDDEEGDEEEDTRENTKPGSGKN